jgi:predicted outer membrane repeat protein
MLRESSAEVLLIRLSWAWHLVLQAGVVGALSGVRAWGVTIHVPVDEPTIQAAIDAAEPGDVIEIAAGRYAEAVDLLGKAIQIRSSNPADPAVVAATVIDGNGAPHVVQCVSGEGPETVLRGLTITGGDAAGGRGGGLYITSSGPTVTDCTFTGNSAGLFGGAVFSQSGSPTVQRCAFIENSAASGGAVFTIGGSPVLELCTFEANTSSGSGGAVFSQQGAPTIDRCAFQGNMASGSGGALELFDGSQAAVTGCTFTGNTAGAFGGAVFNESGSTFRACVFSGNAAFSGGAIYLAPGDPLIARCRFEDNHVTGSGGAIYCASGAPTIVSSACIGNSAAGTGGGIASSGGTVSIANCTLTGNAAGNGGGGLMAGAGAVTAVASCIVWGNMPGEVSGPGALVTHSLVAGGIEGTGNIDGDPMLVDPRGGDLRLQSDSPAIDAGNNEAVPPGEVNDLDGLPRFVDDPDRDDCPHAPGTCGGPPVVDMGAHEHPAEITPPCPADVNGSGTVDVDDLVALLLAWGPCPGCPADVTGDGVVNVDDLVEVILGWGACP